MRIGHNEAQVLFRRMGEHLGYKARRSWTREHPTDGVWVLASAHFGYDEVPIAALEVVVTESGKSLRGSIATLEAVSPAVAVLLVQDREIRRGLIRAGASQEQVTRYLGHLMRSAVSDASRSRQRIAVWTFDQMECRARVVLGRSAA